MKNLSDMEDKCVEVCRLLKTVAHPQRLMVLCHLSEGEKNVSELQDLCEGISQSQLSQFLNRMQREGLLEHRREGKFSYYYIEDKSVKRLVQSLHKIFS